MLSTSHRARYLAVGIALCGMWFGSCAWAQDAEAPKPKVAGEPSAEELAQLPQATFEDMSLEMPMLLGSVKLPPIQDPVWHLSPDKIAGKSRTKYRLTMVPLRLADKKAFKAGTPPVGPADGRFVAWYIPYPSKDLLGGEKSQVPAGAPRLTAGIAVTADGRIHWAVDRFTTTMELSRSVSLTDEKTFYVMSIERELLAKLAPPPFKFPPPYKRGVRVKSESIEAYLAKEEKAREAYGKKKIADRQAYDAQVAKYREVMDKVGTLPFKFSEPVPELVYALYYTRELATDHTYGSYGEAGSWSTSGEEWAALTGLAARGNKTPSKAERAGLEAKLKLLAPMANSKHPAALQALAEALSGSGLLNNLEEESEPFAVGAKLLASPNPWARQRVMKSLLAANISTGKAALLVHAVDAADQAGNEAAGDALRLSALRVQLHAKETDTDAKRIRAVAAVLTDPHGPDAAQALSEFLKVIEPPVTGRGAGSMPLARAQDAASAFKMVDIKDAKRRAAVIAAVLEASDKSPLCAMLADEWLLGSGAGLAADTLRGMSAMAAAKSPARVPLFQADHHFLGLLTAKEDAVRTAAWQALPACEVRQVFAVPHKPKGAPTAPPVETANAVFPKLVEDGLALKQTPASLPMFLAASADAANMRADAMHGLSRVLIEGDAAAVKQAAGLFAGAELGPHFVETLSALPAHLRLKAVTRCYEAKAAAVPDPAGLIMVPELSDGLVRWFGVQFVKGVLPSATQWAGQAPAKAPLLDWVLAQDPALARGAVSVLAYREGADDAMAAVAVTRMLAKPYKLEGQMQREWVGCQTDIFMAVLQKSQGVYAVRVAAFARGDPAWREEVAGQVTLKATDGTVNLGIPGVSMTVMPVKKRLTLADFALLDRVNVKTRRNLGLGEFSGVVEFQWQAPCWVAQWHPDADHVAQVRLTPGDWNQAVPLPTLPRETKKK